MASQFDEITSADRRRVVDAPDGPERDDPALRCSCTLSALSTPAGDILVLRVAGEIDEGTTSLVAAAVADALGRPASHLVVDLAGVISCGAPELSVVVDAGRQAAENGTGYALSGASVRITELLRLMWPDDELPTRYAGAAAAVMAAMSVQVDRLDRARPVPSRRPGLRVVVDPDRFDRDDDGQLVVKARAGDVDAYRELVRRHRRLMYRSALQTLGESDDPDDVARDIAIRLQVALALFAEAGPG